MTYNTGDKKTCYCETCGKFYHPLGIMRHIAMHRDKKENCEVTFTHGDRYKYEFEKEEE